MRNPLPCRRPSLFRPIYGTLKNVQAYAARVEAHEDELNKAHNWAMRVNKNLEVLAAAVRRLSQGEPVSLIITGSELE